MIQKGGRVRPWLWLPSQLAHDLSPYTLPLISHLKPCRDNQWKSFQWKGLSFSNPMGIAGGVDKTGQCLRSWQRLGAGFLEVGTVTPKPQGPNPGKIMDRDIERSALWNKMGFPNKGVQELLKNLDNFKDRQVPLFINVGKNRQTPNEKAHEDYISCIQQTHSYGDVFVINLSSPNTKGLRDLLTEAYLKSFLSSVVDAAKQICPEKPLLLKLSPDMEEESLFMTLDHSSPFVDGWILTNTTKQRSSDCRFPAAEGGVSGGPLTDISRDVLRKSIQHLGDKRDGKLVISAGGILSEGEIQSRLDCGADLVQFYAALVFQGPFFFSQTLRNLRNTKV